MKKIKILQFPVANARGGITQYALKNWEFIDKDKFQFDFATLSKELDFAGELIQEGCKVHYLSCYAEEDEQQFITEFNRILDEGYDVLHLHTSYWKSFIVEELAIKRGVPKIIVHSHSTMIDVLNEEQRQAALKLHCEQRERFTSSLATDFWACSQLAAEWLFGEQIPKERIKILKNAIDVRQFSYNESIRNEYRRKLGLEGCFVLGHTGRFVYQKNHDFLIETFYRVSQVVPDARLMLIGSGPLEDKIRSKVRQYDMEDKVLFMGKRDDVNGLLQAMDVFLLPSRFEGLPIVLVEAQASGIKCITSKEVTAEAAITNNVEFLPLDVQMWMDKIIQLTNQTNRIVVDESIMAAGYDIRQQIRKLEDLYL